MEYRDSGYEQVGSGITGNGEQAYDIGLHLFALDCYKSAFIIHNFLIVMPDIIH